MILDKIIEFSKSCISVSESAAKEVKRAPLAEPHGIQKSHVPLPGQKSFIFLSDFNKIWYKEVFIIDVSEAFSFSIL